MRLEIQVVGLERLLGGLGAAPGLLKAEQDVALTRAGLEVEAAVKSRTPYRTRRLFSSIAALPAASFNNASEVRIGTQVEYAGWVEEGRGPIVAKNVKALRFNPGGGFIFRRSVGPAAGKHMFRDGFREALPKVLEELSEAVVRALRAIARGV